jgi:hypothetical protein
MLQKIRFFDKKDPKLSLSELLSWMTRIQIYSYGLLCDPVLSMLTAYEKITILVDNIPLS